LGNAELDVCFGFASGVRYGRRASVCAESYDPSIDSDVEHFVVHPKTDIQRQRLTDSVAGILLFRALDGEQMQRVVDAMFERRVKKGEHVIDQGDDGDNFYVVDSGRTCKLMQILSFY